MRKLPKLWIPRPFKLLQAQLGILEEWNLFKQSIWCNKFKIAFLGGLLAFPFYQEQVLSGVQSCKEKAAAKIEEALKPNQTFSAVFERNLKQTMEQTFKNEQIKKESSAYIETLARNQKVVDSVLHLLNRAVQSEEVKEEAKLLGKEVSLRLLDDPEVKNDIGNLVGRALRDQEVKSELMGTIRWIFYQKETKEALVHLLARAFEEDEMRQALSTALSTSLLKVCSEPETSEAMKDFMLKVLQAQVGVKETPLIDMVLDKIKKKPRGLDKDYETSDQQFDPFGLKKPKKVHLPPREKYY